MNGRSSSAKLHPGRPTVLQTGLNSSLSFSATLNRGCLSSILAQVKHASADGLKRGRDQGVGPTAPHLQLKAELLGGVLNLRAARHASGANFSAGHGS
jgi:hypothetical protein